VVARCKRDPERLPALKIYLSISPIIFFGETEAQNALEYALEWLCASVLSGELVLSDLLGQDAVSKMVNAIQTVNHVTFLFWCDYIKKLTGVALTLAQNPDQAIKCENFLKGSAVGLSRILSFSDEFSPIVAGTSLSFFSFLFFFLRHDGRFSSIWSLLM
jgi:hypothetical protein